MLRQPRALLLLLLQASGPLLGLRARVCRAAAGGTSLGSGGQGQANDHYTPPVPNTAAAEMGNTAFDLQRDGSQPVRYTAPRSEPGNGALFDKPLALEECDGGWRCATRDKHSGVHWGLQTRNDSTDFCDFAVVSADDLTAELFNAHYKDKQPLIVRRGSSRAAKEPFRNAEINKLLARAGLTEAFGPHPAAVGTSLGIVQSSGTGSRDMNIGEFLRTFMPEGGAQSTWAGEPLYIFQRDVLGDDILTPVIEGLFDPADQHVTIWMVGPPLSGTAFHFHPAAWTGLVYGRKRWFIYPPSMTAPGGGSGQNAFPSFPMSFWFTDVLPRLPTTHQPLQCMQHGGDLIYIPEGWNHGVLNVDDVVAASFQNQTFQNLTFVDGSELQTLLDGSLADRRRELSVYERYAFVGGALLKAGRLDEAAAEFRAVLETDDQFAAAWTQLGIVEAQRKNFHRAAECHRRATALYPPAQLAREGLREFLRVHGAEAEAALAGLDSQGGEPALRTRATPHDLEDPATLIKARCDPFALLDAGANGRRTEL